MMRKEARCVLILLLLLGLQSMVSAAVWNVSPWTDDASTDIDSSKTYTHAINFSDGDSATVNGVPFTNAWTGFDDGSFNDNRTFSGDNDNNISGDSSVLGTHFRYWGVSLTLTGLTPGGFYELTFFSTAWENEGRTVTLTDTFSSFVFNQDVYGLNNGIKIVGVYSADVNGELKLELVNDFHIYAFANCEYIGDLPVVVSPIAPDAFEGGNRVEMNAVMTWAEEFAASMPNPGFDVYMDPNESMVTAMDAQTLVSSMQSGFSFDPELDNGTVYYWRVAAYADIENTEPNQILSEVSSFSTVYLDEHWSDSSWSDDADSGISVGKTYTHKVNFNASEGAPTYVNGVFFENDSDRTGSNWALAGARDATDRGHNVAGDSGSLVTNMYYNSDAVLTLTGLNPGQDYILTKYTRGWGDVGGRLVHFVTSADGRTTTIDGNIDGDGNGHLFNYAYTAPASGELVLTFNPLGADSWHHYAFSNEIAVPVYVDPTPLPGANVNSNVELSWVLNGNVVGPTTYNLKVATDAAMTNLVINEIDLPATSQTLYLSSDTIYYWQVEVVEDDAVVYSSPVWDFETTPPQDATMVIEWKFDETIGNMAEQTGPTEDADGYLVGFNDPNTLGVPHVAGLVNNGLLLNGQDEYVDVSHANIYMPTADGQSFAISGYIRTFDDYGPLFSMRNSTDGEPIIDIALGADGVQDLPGRICLLVRDDNGSMSNVNSGITVNDGRWHNFIVTRFEGKWTLYIDGVSRGVINGAATGDVTLDMMGIGTSLNWLANDWNPDRAYYRHFKGFLDEFTVWNGQLQLGQIADLAAIIPPQGDIDFDLDSDIDDLKDLTADWLADTLTPIQSAAVLEDMESYTIDPNTYTNYWAEAEPDEYEYGTLDLSIVTDTDGLYGQVMQMDYVFTGQPYCHLPLRLLERRVNSSLFDTLSIRLKKLAGSEPGNMILDFYDGRGNVDPLVEGMLDKGRITLDLSVIAEEEWVTLEAAISGDVNFETCTDLYQIMVSIGDGGADVGTLLIDSIELSDATEDCVRVVGEMVPDMNGDCFVDMLDFSEIAEGWMNGI